MLDSTSIGVFGTNQTRRLARHFEWPSEVRYRLGIRMRFRPNRRASTDHAPGPIIAIAAPSAAITMCMDQLVPERKSRESSEIAMSEAETGVQRPMIKRLEQTAASNCAAADSGRAVTAAPSMNCASGIVAIARRSTRPVPGQPSGNAEKSRCTRGPVFRLRAVCETWNPEKWLRRTPLSGYHNGHGQPLVLYRSMIPRLRPMVTACVRSLAPSLARIFLT
jgi:hypothetical protein